MSRLKMGIVDIAATNTGATRPVSAVFVDPVIAAFLAAGVKASYSIENRVTQGLVNIAFMNMKSHAFAGIPSVSGVPSVLDISGVLDIPNVPGISNIPSISTVPDVP